MIVRNIGSYKRIVGVVQIHNYLSCFTMYMDNIDYKLLLRKKVEVHLLREMIECISTTITVPELI